MLFIYLSRIYRSLLPNHLPPINCYAKIWSPYNACEVCDCNIWCKKMARY